MRTEGVAGDGVSGCLPFAAPRLAFAATPRLTFLVGCGGSTVSTLSALTSSGAFAGSSVGSSLTEGSAGSSSLTSMTDLEGEGEGDRLSERITSRLGVAPELSEREPERDVDLVVTLLLLGPVF